MMNADQPSAASVGERRVLAVQCGGAIDLDYPSKLHGYHFQVCVLLDVLL